jgi:hypothetical protein
MKKILTALTIILLTLSITADQTTIEDDLKDAKADIDKAIILICESKNKQEYDSACQELHWAIIWYAVFYERKKLVNERGK